MGPPSSPCPHEPCEFFPVGQRGERGGVSLARRRMKKDAPTPCYLFFPLPTFSLPTDYLTIGSFLFRGRWGWDSDGVLFWVFWLQLIGSLRSVPGGRDSIKYLNTWASPDISFPAVPGRREEEGKRGGKTRKLAGSVSVHRSAGSRRQTPIHTYTHELCARLRPRGRCRARRVVVGEGTWAPLRTPPPPDPTMKAGTFVH